jgi:hypothetical protein
LKSRATLPVATARTGSSGRQSLLGWLGVVSSVSGLGIASPEFAEVGIFPQALSGPEAFVFATILLALSLALLFFGRSVIKGVSFLVVGVAGAAFGLAVGSFFLGATGALIGGILGFLVGGAIGLLLAHIGMGLALGYFGYLATNDLTHLFALAVLVAAILFFVGVALSSRILELATAVLGGVIMYGVLVFFGLPPLYAAPVSLALAAAGFYAQENRRNKSEHWKKM